MAARTAAAAAPGHSRAHRAELGQDPAALWVLTDEDEETLEPPCKPRTLGGEQDLSASRAQTRSPQAFLLETGQHPEHARSADPRANREQNWIQAPQAELLLPAVLPDLFLEAGAVIAERASRDHANPREIEAALSRAAEQGSLLLSPLSIPHLEAPSDAAGDPPTLRPCGRGRSRVHRWSRRRQARAPSMARRHRFGASRGAPTCGTVNTQPTL
jgi:hypothetical protein